MITLTHVLVATDFGPASDTALAYGRELARTFHAKLTVMHVVDDIVGRLMAGAAVFDAPGDVRAAQRQLEVDAGTRMGALLSEEDRRQLGAETLCVTSSAPAAAILDQARRSYADLVVVGTHGRGALAHAFFGSVAERVVRLSPCPVLAVRNPEVEFVRPDALQAIAHA